MPSALYLSFELTLADTLPRAPSLAGVHWSLAKVSSRDPLPATPSRVPGVDGGFPRACGDDRAGQTESHVDLNTEGRLE